jgi:hypothetical protein
MPLNISQLHTDTITFKSELKNSLFRMTSTQQMSFCILTVMLISFHLFLATSFILNSTNYYELLHLLTLSNPIFLPTTHSPALIFLQAQPYEYNAQSPVHINTHGLPRNRKSTTCAICWLKSVLHEEKCRTGSDSGAGGPQTQQKCVGRLPTSERNRKIIMSDEVRHRIGKG